LKKNPHTQDLCAEKKLRNFFIKDIFKMIHSLKIDNIFLNCFFTLNSTKSLFYTILQVKNKKTHKNFRKYHSKKRNKNPKKEIFRKNPNRTVLHYEKSLLGFEKRKFQDKKSKFRKYKSKGMSSIKI